MHIRILRKNALLLFLGLVPGACASAAQETGTRTIRPGAPGEANQVLTAEEIARTEHPLHTAADVSFMQGMLIHHDQALVMTALVAGRTRSQDITLLARRIELSQDDEIQLMRRWLRERGEPEEAADPHAGHHGGQHAGGAPSGPAVPMHGMLSGEQLARLEGSRDREFDQLFLEFMIQHHEGAVEMVADLFASPGAGQEEEIFQFASHVEADQNIEIRRMLGMLNALRR